MRPRVANVLRQLRQRRVGQAGAVYAAAAFALLQLIDLLADALSLPDWTLPIAGLAVVLGFPPALLLSWAFDLGAVELAPKGAGAGRRGTRPVRLAVAAAVVLGLFGAAIFTSRRLPASGPAVAAVVKASPPHGSAAESDGLVQRAREYFNRLDHESNELAIEFARRAITLDPGHAPAYAILGSALANRMRFGAGPEWADSALAAGQRAIRLDPGLADGFRTLGIAYFRLGRYPEALEAYERAVELNPNDQRAIASAGTIHAFQGRPLDALRWTRRAIAIDPRSADAPLLYQNLVALYLDVNLPLHAERMLEQASAADPVHAKLLTLATEIALRRGDHDEAAALADTLVRDGPTDAYAHLLAGDARLFGGDLEGARRMYGRAYRLAPRAEGVRHYAPVLLAWTLRPREPAEALRLLDEFEAFARREVGGGTRNYTLFLSMAASRAMRGDSADALEWLDRALAAGGVSLEWALEQDPLLESIRPSPRFRQMQASVTAAALSLRTAILEQES